MKEEILAFISSRIDWHKREHIRLKKAFCQDQAAHEQICINVYNIFLATYQAMQYDVGKTMIKFSGIISTWDANHRKAYEHHNEEAMFIEQLKLDRALEIIQRVKEMERCLHD